MDGMIAKSETQLTRRGFLKGAGALAAGAAIGAPTIVPSSVFGAAAPSNRVNVGMIGIGRQGFHANLPPFLQFEDVQVVALCDVDSWRLQNALTKVETTYAAKKAKGGSYQGCTTYKDFRELLERTDVDAVMISTPDHWHVPMALAALRAGKDVSLEKPITLSLQEGRILADTVTRYGRVFRTDSEFRSNAYYHTAAALALNGYLGRIRRIRTGTPQEHGTVGVPLEMPVPPELDYNMWLGPAPEAPYTLERVHGRQSVAGRPGWMRIRDYCDGMICNWGTHLNDIAQCGNGTDRTGPVEVEARGKYPDDGGMWNVLIGFEAWYRYANGVELNYKMGTVIVRFEGDEGWVEVGSKGLVASSPALLRIKPKPEDKQLVMKTDKRDFIDAVKTRDVTMEDAEVGHRTTSLCHLANIAVQLGGKRLRWDPEKELFDDEAANLLAKRPPLRAPWRL